MTSKFKTIALCDKMMYVKQRELEEAKKEYVQRVKVIRAK
jgi:hypothetical protein